jgi:uncharacterized damage-inducible protein DinB
VQVTTGVELAADIREAQDRWLAALAGLDASTLEREPALGVWSVREIAGHIAAWNDFILDAAEEIVATGGWSGEAVTDFDAFNACSAERSREQTWQTVRAHLEETVERAERLARGLTSEQLQQPAPFPWGGQGTLAQVLRGTSGHQQEHTHDVQAWRKGRSAA